MQLRPYQQNALNAVIEAWREHQSTLVVMPTGTGKTILFAHAIGHVYPGKAIVVAHREELITQAVDKIQRTTGIGCTIEMADKRANLEECMFGGAPGVVVATVQTLTTGGDGSGRLSKFDPDQFSLLIIDEFHHATASSYRRIIEWFTRNPNLRVLGVTATPDRADEDALCQVVQSVAFDYEITDAIHDGWLVPIKQQFVAAHDLDLSSVRTTAGDLNGADLANVLEHEKCLHQMAGPTIEIIGQRRAIIFTASVRQAERMAEILCRHRAGMADWVCGETPKDKRRELLARFSRGDVQVVANCGVLTEGFDDAGVEVIVQGRPTKSRSMYAQQIGRATRPLPGLIDSIETNEGRRAAIANSKKPFALVVDFVGNSGRHKLVTSADILGGKVDDELMERAVRNAVKSGRPVDMTEEMKKLELRREEERAAAAARRNKLAFKAKYSMREVNPFDVFGIEPHRQRSWDDGKRLSEKQRIILVNQGISPDDIPYAQAKQLLLEIFRRWDQNLCSFKQSKVLKRYGYQVENMKRDEARSLLDRLAANKWKPIVKLG